MRPACYGIPLVRPPNSGMDQDPGKQCVICGNTYTIVTDSTERETLTLFNFPSISQSQGHDSREQFQVTFTTDDCAAILHTSLKSASSLCHHGTNLNLKTSTADSII